MTALLETIALCKSYQLKERFYAVRDAGLSLTKGECLAWSANRARASPRSYG